MVFAVGEHCARASAAEGAIFEHPSADMLDPRAKRSPSELERPINRTQLLRFRGHLAVPIRLDRSDTTNCLEIEKWYLLKVLFSYSSKFVLQLLM
jgi:hypothetical protein